MVIPQPIPSPAPQGANSEQELVLVKNGRRYVFRCTDGHESQMLLQLADMVRDPDNELDWFDAAVLSHQMGQRMGRRLERISKPS